MENDTSQAELPIQPTLASRRSWKRRVSRVVILLVIGYAAICVALVCMETSLVFPGAYPGAGPELSPERFTLEQPIYGSVTTLAYRAEDGEELFGRIAARENPDRVILFLHGNASHAVDLDGWTQRLSNLANATVLTAEYRGFQDDGFTPTEASTIADAVSAIDALSEATGVSPESITIYGRSLGGGVAAGLVEAMENRGAPPKSLILERTFDSAVNVGADRYFWLPVRWLMSNSFNSSARLRNFRGNVVQTHGPDDEIVPWKNGRALFEALTTEHKEWIKVPGLGHLDHISDQTVRQEFETIEALEHRSL